jgi:hypothetical protein
MFSFASLLRVLHLLPSHLARFFYAPSIARGVGWAKGFLLLYSAKVTSGSSVFIQRCDFYYTARKLLPGPPFSPSDAIFIGFFAVIGEPVTSGLSDLRFSCVCGLNSTFTAGFLNTSGLRFIICLSGRKVISGSFVFLRLPGCAGLFVVERCLSGFCVFDAFYLRSCCTVLPVARWCPRDTHRQV